MSEEQPQFDAKPKDSLATKIFLGYLLISIGLILGIDAILFLSNTYLFERFGIWSSILAISVIYAILSIVFYIVLTKLVKPLHVLIDNIELFLQGNWEQRTYFSGNDETSVLANGFNAMADELSQTYLSLENSGIINKPHIPHPTIQTDNELMNLLLEKNQTVFYEKLYKQVQKTFGAVYFFVAEYNRQGNIVSVPFADSGDGPLQIRPFNLGGGLTSIVIKLNKPLLINTKAEMLSIIGNAQKPQNKAKSWMGVPIITNEKAEGALVAQDLNKENAFTEGQFSYLQSLADLVGIRWMNDLLKRDLHQLKTLDEKSAELTRKTQKAENIDDLVKLFGSELREAMNAKELEIILQPVEDYAMNSSNPPIITKKLSN
jgi:hypothetical protein